MQLRLMFTGIRWACIPELDEQTVGFILFVLVELTDFLHGLFGSHQVECLPATPQLCRVFHTTLDARASRTSRALICVIDAQQT